MKYCIYCGKAIPSDSIFCSACGKTQKTEIILQNNHQNTATADILIEKGIFPKIKDNLNINNIAFSAGIIFLLILLVDWFATFELGNAIGRGNKNELESVGLLYDNIQPWLNFKVIYIATLLYWVYKSYKQLPKLSGEKSKWSPGWAIGAWFVPVLNLWRPYQVMTEIWDKSNPNSSPAIEGHRGGLFLFRNRVLSWWLLLIASSLYSRFSAQKIATVISSNPSAFILKRVVLEYCWSIAFSMFSVIWTLYIIQKISDWQKGKNDVLHNNIKVIQKEESELNDKV